MLTAYMNCTDSRSTATMCLAGRAGLPAPQPQQLSFLEDAGSRERRVSERGGIFESVAEIDP